MASKEPVLSAAGIASVVTAVVSVAVATGFVSAEDGDRLSNGAVALLSAIIAFVAVVSHIVAAIKARGKVTPVDPGTGSPDLPTLVP